MLTLADHGTSDYTIVRPEGASPSQVYAAEELQSFVEQMTGARLPIITDADELPAKAILLGDTRFTATVMGAEPDYEALGTDGFTIRAVDPHVVIAGGPARGTLYGVYELLERHCGCRWYATFHSVIPRHETLAIPPTLDDTQTPAITMREPYWYEMLDGDYAARNRANGDHMRLEEKHGGKTRFGKGMFVHTFYRLVPPKEFFGEHPEYFSLIDGERRIGYSQLCLTNPDVLRIVTERVLERIRKDPEAKLFSVSQNDWDGHCQCEPCMEIETREESPAGTLIWFVNQVAEAVEQEFPDVWIETLAYQYTRKPPKTIRPRHNVVPRLCTIECDFSLPLDVSPYPQNVRLVDDMRGWSAIADRLYVWDYTTNFHNYIGPHPNINTLAANVKFFRDNNVVGLFEQGAAEGPHAEFTELRGWMLAKLLWNPDQSVEALYDDFFAGYYGAAAAPIRAYFDELQTLASDPEITVRIFDRLRNKWLTMEFIERAEKLFAEAEALAAGDDELLYRVRMSGIPVLWARVQVMPSAKRRYVLRDDRMVLAKIDPLRLAAGTELLSRIREGGVRIREYDGYHTQELIDLTGEAEGFPLTTVTDGGLTAGTAPGLGGSVALWRASERNLLCPTLGGIEIIDRHKDPERPSFREHDVTDTTDDTISLRVKKPTAVWGPQSKERLGIDRTIRVSGSKLEFVNTYSMKEQDREISPMIRVAIDIGDARGVMVGANEFSLPDGETTASFELDAAALAGGEVHFGAVGAPPICVTLPEGSLEAMSVYIDADARGAVLIGIARTRTLTAGSKLGMSITAEVVE